MRLKEHTRGCMTPAGGACGTSVVDVCDMGCMWDYSIGCACYMDVYGTTALVVHGMWMYVGLLHWLCMVCGCMWDSCIGSTGTCYVDVYGTVALVVHAVWMYVVYCIGFM